MRAYTLNVYDSWLTCLKQAWSSTTSEWMGRWAIICHTMPYSNKPDLCVQLHYYWTTRNSLLACSHFMA